MSAAKSSAGRLIGAVLAAVIAIAVYWYATHERYDLVEAARRGEAHLRDRGPRINPAMVFILDYLDRRFGLEWARPVVDRARQAARDCEGPPTPPEGACSIQTTQTFIRLIDPAARLTPEQIAAAPNTLDTVTGAALYCKTNGLPSTFLADVERLISKNDYDPPHALLALQWAIEQGCIDARTTEVEAIRARVLDNVAQLAHQVPQDQSIEAVALLSYAGAGQRVQSEWLQTIAAAQKDDGGWGEHGKAPSNDHTTMLALWALLEATREGKPVAWVPQ